MNEIDQFEKVDDGTAESRLTLAKLAIVYRTYPYVMPKWARSTTDVCYAAGKVSNCSGAQLDCILF